MKSVYHDAFAASINSAEKTIRCNFTLDNKLCLDDYVGDAVSCVDYSAEKAIEQLKSGWFTVDDIYTPSHLWTFPSGAFHGAQGGPC